MTTSNAEDSPQQYVLRLFVSGQTVRSSNAIRNLESICADELKGRYQLEVIDVLDDPDAADEAKIIVTPTLLKQLPPPIGQLIGDLSSREKVLVGLFLVPPAAEQSPR